MFFVFSLVVPGTFLLWYLWHCPESSSSVVCAFMNERQSGHPVSPSLPGSAMPLLAKDVPSTGTSSDRMIGWSSTGLFSSCKIPSARSCSQRREDFRATGTLMARLVLFYQEPGSDKRARSTGARLWRYVTF
jgi:hypothetical protein